MVRIEPGAFDACRVRQIGHWPGVLVAFDEIGKLVPVFEEQGRARWDGPHIKPRHGPKELDTGDPLRRRKGGGHRIDQTDGDVVAIDIVTLDGALAVWADDAGRRFVLRINQARSTKRL